MGRTAGWVLMVIALGACREQVFEPVREGLVASVRLSGTVRVATKADLLFVVDDSRSMQNEQEKLARGFEALVEALEALDPPVGWRVAVLTTSVDERFGPCDQTDPSAPATCSAAFGGRDFSCESGRCVRRFAPPSLEILDPAELSPAELAARFRHNVQAGLEGSRQEQPLRALRLALESGRLQDFRRPDARLVAFLVSDEDDCSDSTGRTMALELSSSGEIDRCAEGALSGVGLDGVQEWVSWFRSQGDVALGAAAGVDPGGAPGLCVDEACATECSSTGRSLCEGECLDALQPARCVDECVAECRIFCGAQAPGRRIAQAVRALAGPLCSVCASDYGPTLASLARVLGIPERIELLSPPADSRAVFLEITRAGRLISCQEGRDWTLDLQRTPSTLEIVQTSECRLLPDDSWELRYLAAPP